MFNTQFFKRSTLKVVCAVVLVSSLAMGGQVAAKPQDCTWFHIYYVSTVPPYWHDFWACL